MEKNRVLSTSPSSAPAETSFAKRIEARRQRTRALAEKLGLGPSASPAEVIRAHRTARTQEHNDNLAAHLGLKRGTPFRVLEMTWRQREARGTN